MNKMGIVKAGKLFFLNKHLYSFVLITLGLAHHHFICFK